MHEKSASVIETRMQAAVLACEAQGARMTELRGRVLRLVLEAEAPPTAYQILDRLKGEWPGAVPPTVYRALDFLTARGLVHRIERLAAYVACHGAGSSVHAVQFLICRRCGRVAELEDPGVSAALARAAVRAGFRAGSATVELDGTCAACL